MPDTGREPQWTAEYRERIDGLIDEYQVLRELAHHSGHADILREQILASRSP